jgi:hypothetical protein
MSVKAMWIEGERSKVVFLLGVTFGTIRLEVV